ncbi:MAG TPA: hypothetical protein VHR66_01180, partial [Gemmataceae bacterium]|nr:hypothetical protein [Gemmataceae bacterium]
MAICDVCNSDASPTDGTMYSADEFRTLVAGGYEPPASARSFMSAMGMTVGQWKSGLVAINQTPWLLCPSCARSAKLILPGGAGAFVAAGMSREEAATFSTMLGMLAQANTKSSGSSAGKAKKRVPCPHCREMK